MTLIASGNFTVLREIRVIVRVGRGTTAEQSQFTGIFCSDLVPASFWNEDGISGRDRTCFAVDLHGPGSSGDVVEFFAELVVVALRHSSRRESGFGEALLLNGGVGSIEQSSDR